MISNDRPWLTVSGTKPAQVCPNLGFLGPIQLLVSEFLSSFVQSMNSLPRIRCYFLRVWYLYMYHYEKMVSQKFLVLTKIKMLISSHHKVHLSRSSSQSPATSLGAFKCQSQIFLFHFGQHKIIPGFDFGFGSFRHFSAWQV